MIASGAKSGDAGTILAVDNCTLSSGVSIVDVSVFGSILEVLKVTDDDIQSSGVSSFETNFDEDSGSDDDDEWPASG